MSRSASVIWVYASVEWHVLDMRAVVQRGLHLRTGPALCGVEQLWIELELGAPGKNCPDRVCSRCRGIQ